MNLKSEISIHILQENTVCRFRKTEITVGDVILISAETRPQIAVLPHSSSQMELRTVTCDCLVLEGELMVDEESLRGYSKPVCKITGRET